MNMIKNSNNMYKPQNSKNIEYINNCYHFQYDHL